MNRIALLFFCILPLADAAAIEIATGKMLGGGYEPRSFYVRDNPRQPWRKTYTGPAFRPEAAGRLMNLRIAQAIFDDEWLTEFPFDPEKNTDRVIDALDDYKAHGVLAISVCLQGGNPGYNREFPDIRRSIAYKPGPGKGAHISAFRPDGSLKPAWMARLKRLQQALNQRGMILNLIYFYQGQDELFPGPDAIRQAVVNATDWVIDNNARNVILEIANEQDIRGWDHDEWIHRNMGELIQLARSRFQAKKAGWAVPISSSSGPSMAVFENVRTVADLTIYHGNNRPIELKRSRTRELFHDPSVPGPIYMNEDDSGRETTPEVLAGSRLVAEDQLAEPQPVVPDLVR